ncbi:MAG: alpha/beta hydrolase [Bacteroidota bacterium]|nr:alpha/beta hydrolase [Bacteroidota bacterium]
MIKKLKPVLIFSFLGLIIIGWAGCFRKYRMTSSDIKGYYNTKSYKPTFTTYKVNDRQIHFASTGCDTLPMLLMIHGAPGEWYGYIHLMDDSLLRQKFRIVSVDRPGYGKSGYGIPELSISKQAQYFQPIIDSHKNNKPIIIIGRSFGAPVAAKLASENQDKVKALILAGAAIDPEKEKFWWFSSLGKWMIIRWMLPKPLNVATDEKYAHVEELQKLIPIWQKIKIHVSVLHGGDDWIVDTANVTFARKMLINAKAKFHVIPHTGHLVSNEKPELLKKEIFNYLQTD